MSGKDEYRIFVGGLSRDVTERVLENTFSRFGKIIETQVSFFFLLFLIIDLKTELLKELKNLLIDIYNI